MPDALLVSDQHITEGLLGPQSAHRTSDSYWFQTLWPGNLAGLDQDPFCKPELMNRGRALQQCDLVIQGEGRLVHLFETKARSVADHLTQGKGILRHLALAHERENRNLEGHEEMRWLAANKHRFLGQWIAIQGGRLLAAAPTAREVFVKVANLTPPPLVIRVDDGDLPFGGW